MYKIIYVQDDNIYKYKYWSLKLICDQHFPLIGLESSSSECIFGEAFALCSADIKATAFERTKDKNEEIASS